ncbi:hypothetical protein [Actinoplanes sp. NBRC 103695]|uniref:hypothetical protein n=1 Tax=Actinoplanes sp. NBRC 103695 TaxID=3032202 RepID=UPI0024A05E70|nr:hypothetical protein [Actinoplanes sp. NBRC 103695]GLZ00979.1 hypothetical protein Acsp02_82310 [Actinoplanes sp. NBRC 103695]
MARAGRARLPAVGVQAFEDTDTVLTAEIDGLRRAYTRLTSAAKRPKIFVAT